MQATSMHICLEGMKYFARHGVEPQETAVGSYFIFDLKLKTDFSRAARTDEVADTLNYAAIHAVLKEEMRVPSKLLEHVCQRIAERLFREFPAMEEMDIRLSKENPPMGAEGKHVGVEVHYTR